MNKPPTRGCSGPAGVALELSWIMIRRSFMPSSLSMYDRSDASDQVGVDREVEGVAASSVDGEAFAMFVPASKSLIWTAEAGEG